MPNHKATWKSLRQDKVRHERNVAEKSRLRTAVKKVRASSAEGNVEAAAADYQKAISLLDKAAKRNVIHRKQADRKKSRLQKLLNKTSRS